MKAIKTMLALLLTLAVAGPATAATQCGELAGRLNSLKKSLLRYHSQYSRAGCGNNLWKKFSSLRSSLIRQKASKAAIRNAYNKYRQDVTRCRRLASLASRVRDQYNRAYKSYYAVRTKCRGLASRHIPWNRTYQTSFRSAGRIVYPEYRRAGLRRTLGTRSTWTVRRSSGLASPRSTNTIGGSRRTGRMVRWSGRPVGGGTRTVVGRRSSALTASFKASCRKVQANLRSLKASKRALITTWKRLKCDQSSRRTYLARMRVLKVKRMSTSVMRAQLNNLKKAFPGPAKGGTFCTRMYYGFRTKIMTHDQKLRTLYRKLQKCSYR